MNALTRSVVDLTELFDRLGVVYAFMGGLAVRVYGIPRATYDIDITIAIEREQLPQLYKSFKELGCTVPEAYETGWVDQVAGMPLVKLHLLVEDNGIDVDLFLAESPFQQSILNRRRRTDINGASAYLVSPEDLILLKLVAGRPRDFADVYDILFIQTKLDSDYMREWADRLGVTDRLSQVSAGPPSI